MSKVLAALLSSAALLALGAAPSAASAATLFITDVQVGNGNFGDVNVAGYGSPWATPILVTDSAGHSYFTYCVDLEHDIYVTGGQNLPYHLGALTLNGLGNPLPPHVSNEIGQLVSLGHYFYSQGNVDAQVAAQAAIWQLEYGGVTITPDASHPNIGTYFSKFIQIQDNNRGPAMALLSEAGTQNLAIGGVPEPATWAMMILGFGMIGAAMRRRGAKAAAAAA
jgi:hypothetical protein